MKKIFPALLSIITIISCQALSPQLPDDHKVSKRILSLVNERLNSKFTISPKKNIPVGEAIMELIIASNEYNSSRKNKGRLSVIIKLSPDRKYRNVNLHSKETTLKDALNDLCLSEGLVWQNRGKIYVWDKSEYEQKKE